ncbi:MAG: ABC transporter ATP-binding protein [Flavobacteriales bacterium]|nr:ABC transporter ATP-binding protein [Flavobacteriales bacterium]HQW39913.1 ABC transporter ATP-binding protein [Flavobacteriales bacterium]
MGPIHMKVLLETRGLAVGYHGKRLVEGIDLTLFAGQVVSLLAVNGGGKSTVLRALTGGMVPIEGSIEMEGRPTKEMTAMQRARAWSVVLTERPSAGLLDVRTLVSLGRQPWTGHLGRLTSADHSVVENAMQRTGVLQFATRSLSTLSDGEVQRVMIARALAQDTPLIILDEPTAFLDLVHRVGVMRLLRNLAHEQGKGILLSTHDLQTAMDLSDRLLVIHGNTLWSGTPVQAKAEGVLERTFVVEGMRFDHTTGAFRMDPPAHE